MLTSPLVNLRRTFFDRERLAGAPVAGLHGVVVDVPMGHGLDTLAAYADGSARYINHSGKTVLWDVKEDNPLRPLVDRLLTAAAPIATTGLPRPFGPAPDADEDGLATVLTPQGLFVKTLRGDVIAGDLLSAGAALMQVMVRATARESPPTPPGS